MLQVIHRMMFFFVSGFAKAKFGKDNTTLTFADIVGDATGSLYVANHQILKAAIKEGTLGHFTTSISIYVGEYGVLHVPQSLTVAGVQLDIHGTCTFRDVVVERGGMIQGYNTTYTSEYVNGKYRPTSTRGAYQLDSMVLKAGSKFTPYGGLKMVIGKLELKRYVIMETDFVNLNASTLILEREAQFSTVDRVKVKDVPARAHGQGKQGGAHAAAGGVGQGVSVQQASMPYGTIFRPRTPGAPGGNGGYGGGTIQIQTNTLWLDGILRASGENSKSGGGGAGGSINISCDVLRGLGFVEAKGGSVSSAAAGAGSGGHIAVYMEADQFKGSYRATGGSSPAPHGDGGPGSIYKMAGIYERLTIDNENGQKDYYTTLDEEELDLKFSIIDIYNSAKLQIVTDNKSRSIDVKSVNGDGTGLIRVRQHQTGTLERDTRHPQAKSKLDTNLELQNGGKFILSETTTVLGLGDVALSLDGEINGLVNLYLGPGRKMRIGPNAKILPLSGVEQTSDVDVSFGVLQLEPGSQIVYEQDLGANIFAGNINFKFSTKIYADFFNISVGTMDLELDSVMSCSGPARQQSETIDGILGSGLSDSSGHYGGAGHGGTSGGVPARGGVSYSSLYKPSSAGSRGSHSSIHGKSGGRGGGWVRINIGSLLILDGTIAADGESAVPGGSQAGGGGSGGSIWINTYNVEGYGGLSAAGGDGGTSRAIMYGAGSGGRLAVYSDGQIMFEGFYSVPGGIGPDDTESAGCGTVYLQDVRNYQKHTHLILDNKNRPLYKYVTIDEADLNYFFNEVHLLNKATLHMSKSKASSLDIFSLYGDGSGILHSHKGQTLYIEYRPQVRNAFLSGVNFIVDSKSETCFPSITYIYGNGVTGPGHTEKIAVSLSGSLTGISDLILGYERMVYLTDGAHTATFNVTANNSNPHPPGTVKFGTVDLRSYSQIKASPDSAMSLTAATVHARFQSIISAETVKILAGELNIEAGATVSAAATDRPGDSMDEARGTGNNASGNVITGTGGGYASKGGGR